MDPQQPPSPMVNPPPNQPPPPPPPPPQKCPRCDSSNTKFCYYNNYSLTQPRYFCKACRRYWTQGGTLRNVPVGGGRRRSSKRSKNSAFSPALRSQNLAAGQSSRPVVPPVGGSVFGGGINQWAAAASFGGGSSQVGANMTMLQGISLQSLKPPAAAAQQFQPPTNFLPLNQSLIPQRNLSFWNQSIINTGASSYSAAASSSFWSGNAADGGDLAPSSSSRNQCCDNYRGFNTYNPSQ